jgi:hypothetical protein
MPADYGLLGGGFSAANALAALGAGQQQAMQQQRFAVQQEELQRQQQLRAGLQGAYDPTTGQLDRVAARTAYAGAGDVEGAMAVDKQAAAARAAQYKEAVEKVGLTAQLLGGVRDEASFQQARQVAMQNGLDVSGIPQRYDPAWVQQTRTQAMTMAQQLEAEAPKYQVVPEGGTLVNTRDPQALNAVGMSQQPAGQGGGNLESMAAAAIAAGADPAAVRARIQQLQGGAAPQANSPFPIQ